MWRRISQRVWRYINRKLIPCRERVMLVQTFRFLCRNFYIGIVWNFVSNVLLHLSITHVILLQFQQKSYIYGRRISWRFQRCIERHHTTGGWRVRLVWLWPLFAQDFAVLLGIFGNGVQPILVRSSSLVRISWNILVYSYDPGLNTWFV